MTSRGMTSRPNARREETSTGGVWHVKKIDEDCMKRTMNNRDIMDTAKPAEELHLLMHLTTPRTGLGTIL